jgi:hypothetical protein
MKIGPEKGSHWYSTAGGRELRLKARPPARFSSQAVSKELTSIKDKETKTTVPSGNSYFWHIESPSNRLPGNSYFWRTAPWGVARLSRIGGLGHLPRLSWQVVADPSAPKYGEHGMTVLIGVKRTNQERFC